jgi:hypothetical protein
MQSIYAKHKLFIVIFLGLALPISYAVKNIDVPWQRIIDQLESYTKNFPQEKVHLHTDKPFYDIGDDIWLKGYVVNASSHKPSGISKLLYVELLNDKNIKQQLITLQVIDGMSDGHISIPDSLRAGLYKMRAYTKYMLNYNPELIFEKTLPIGYIDTSQQIIQKETKKAIQIQFFPEGGDLINGLRSKVGIKAINDAGLGIAVEGNILNQKGEIITSFNTAHLLHKKTSVTMQKLNLMMEQFKNLTFLKQKNMGK